MSQTRRYDLTLEYEDLGETPVNVGLMLAKDKDQRPLWDAGPLPGLQPSYNPGRANYINANPEDDLVFQEEDWRVGLASGGHGGDDRFRGRIFAPPKLNTTTWDTSPAAPALANKSFEDGDPPTGWASIGGTWSRSNTQAHADTYSGKMIWASNPCYAAQSISNFAVVKGHWITISVWVYCTGADQAELQVWEAGGTGTHYDSGKNAGSGWEQLIVSCFASQVSSASVQPRVYFFSGTAYCDDVETSTTQVPPNSDGCIGFAVFKEKLYLAFSHALCRWDTGTSKWIGVWYSGRVIKDVCNYADTYLLIALGGGSAPAKYWYSTDGDAWTQSTMAADDSYANYFASVVAAGGETLWKGYGREIKSSVNPTNAGSWTGNVDIGWSPTDVMELLGYQEALYVRKEEGWYLHDGSNWVPMSRELESLLDTDNFLRSYGWKNNIYFPMGPNALYYYTTADGTLATITPSMYAPDESSFRGKIIALAADEEFLFALLQDSSAVQILSGRWETIEGYGTDFRWHPWAVYSGAAPKCAIVTSVVSEKRLWIGTAGAVSTYPPKYIILPDKYGDVPTATGYKFDTGWPHYTPKFTGNFLDIPKCWENLVLKTKGGDHKLVAGTRSVLAEINPDGEGWEVVATFDKSPLQTKYIPGGLICKEARLRLTGTNGEDDTLIIEGFALHGRLRPEGGLERRFSVKVADSILCRDGTVDRAQTGAAIAKALRGAHRPGPVVITDMWGAKHTLFIQGPPAESPTIDEKARPREQVFSLVARTARVD